LLTYNGFFALLPLLLVLVTLLGRHPALEQQVLHSALAEFTALVAVLSLAIHRTSLVWRWLSVVGLIAAAIFLLGSIFSILGRTPEGSSSLLGISLFILWMLVLSGGLWRTASRSIEPHL